MYTADDSRRHLKYAVCAYTAAPVTKRNTLVCFYLFYSIQAISRLAKLNGLGCNQLRGKTRSTHATVNKDRNYKNKCL